MRKVAIIIKHIYRDDDYRVDIDSFDESMSLSEIRDGVETQLLGNFEVVSVTDRVNI